MGIGDGVGDSVEDGAGDGAGAGVGDGPMTSARRRGRCAHRGVGPVRGGAACGPGEGGGRRPRRRTGASVGMGVWGAAVPPKQMRTAVGGLTCGSRRWTQRGAGAVAQRAHLSWQAVPSGSGVPGAEAAPPRRLYAVSRPVVGGPRGWRRAAQEAAPLR
eukprot:943085-Pleurochrysis_carterae.AAC.2